MRDTNQAEPFQKNDLRSSIIASAIFLPLVHVRIQRGRQIGKPLEVKDFSTSDNNSP